LFIGRKVAAFVSFFGRTPVSIDNKPKPASEVNIVGKIIGDVSTLRDIKSGDKITVIAVV